MGKYLNILNRLRFNSQKSLSDENLIWICGIIEEYKPKRILEIGVSTGGSTCVYLNCIKELGIGSQLISIDSQTIASYKRGKPIIGAEIYELKDYLDLTRFELITGKFIPEVIDDIGTFDMVILDTVHFIPGEILDILCLKNNIHKGTIVIFDDINIESRYPNLYEENLNSVSSNPMILSSIKGHLLFPVNNFPEIGGVILTEDIIDEDRLLLCLCHKWNSDILDYKEKYFNKLEELYGKEFLIKLETIYKKYKYSNFN